MIKSIHSSNSLYVPYISQKSSSSKGTSSSYSPYILTEIDNVIKIFHEKYPTDENYQANLNNKLLYIIRDLLIRIEKLEKRDQRVR